MSTLSAKPSMVVRDWHLLNAKGQVLGRLATQIAIKLMGKHKAIFTPHIDTGDYVVVVNCRDIVVTGVKKVYFRHTGYPGGIKQETLDEKRAKKPEQIIYLAVKRMLPKGPLGRKYLLKLKLFADEQHTHQAQLTAHKTQPKEGTQKEAKHGE
jgi:large subunit ribosomal protein L13